MNTSIRNTILVPKAIKLSISQTKAIDLFNQNSGSYIHSFQFTEHGFFNPASLVHKLKLKGAVIETKTKPATSSFRGELQKHSRLAHYKLVGWKQC